MGRFSDFDQLTVYADRQLTQTLRKIGILVYDQELASLADSQTLLPAGGRMEAGSRASTIWACELMRPPLLPRAPGLTSAHNDLWLWEASHQKSPGDLPYHSKLTTAY